MQIPSVRNARRHWSTRETLLLRLHCPRTGALGYGEASPLPGFSLETFREVEAWFAGQDFTHLDFDQSRQIFHENHSVISGIGAPPAAARFCIEAAMLSGYCRRHGVSLEHALASLSGCPNADSQSPLESATLLDVWEEAPERRARQLVSTGVRAFKIKIGRDLSAETRRLTTIVDSVRPLQPSLRLRLDANQSLSLPRVAELAKSWKELPIEYLEEPCPTAELTTADANAALGMPIALDESLIAGPTRLRPWLDSGQVRALVCKPMYLGGIAVVQQWATLARECGIDLVVSHLFDGPLALRTYEAMARTFARGVTAGLGPHVALPAWEAEVDAWMTHCD